MAQFSVVVTDYIEPDLEWEAKELAKAGIAFTHLQLKFKPEEEVYAAVKDADVIVVNMVKFPASLIARLDKCKLIIRHGAGYDNVDVEACTKKGIVFAYQPDYCSHEVAEQAIALLFACARQVYSSRKILEVSIKKGQWDFSALRKGYRMDGRVLGIIGCGRIGSLVYQKLQHYGFSKILVCDPYINQERIKELGITIVSREQVLRESDFITIHTPCNKETERIINKDTLALMKPTAVFVNTARGPLVDHQALADALKSGKLAFAGIDVFDKEPPEDTYPLLGLENATLTPHLAWYSEDAAWDIRKNIIEDCIRCRDGREPRNRVNKCGCGCKK